MQLIRSTCKHKIFSASAADVSEWTQWLKVNSEPNHRVIELWQKTAKTRLSYIHLDLPQPTCTEIITEWPRYADDKGYVLVRTLWLSSNEYVICEGRCLEVMK
jgi:hypothetical protein